MPPPSGPVSYKCVAAGCNSKYFKEMADRIYANKKFFRFPDPIKDINRRKKWFQIMDIKYTDVRCHLCEDHFEDKCFTDTDKFRLSKVAVPFASTGKSPETETLQCLSNQSESAPPSTSATISVEQNGHQRAIKLALESLDPDFDFTIALKNPKLRNNSLLNKINETSVEKLTLRKKKWYSLNQNQINVIFKLKKIIKIAKQGLKNTYELSKTQFFSEVEKQIDPAVSSFFKSSFKNVGKVKRTWTKKDKIYALAIYKRGPKCYGFLERCLSLPSKRSLTRMLASVPFEAGINSEFMSKMSKTVKRMKPIERNCLLMFDYMSLSQKLTLDIAKDKIIGYVDLGHLGRVNKCANNALVFMVHGLYKTWKQPVAFFFTKGSIRSENLKCIIKDIVVALEAAGLVVLATVCDQGATNCKTISSLCGETPRENGEPVSYFQFNGHKIVTLFDPPHLLKSTRNALFKYDIRYDKCKVAKMQHIRECFKIDKIHRFQLMGKIREEYLNLSEKNRLKMNVSVAARTLSHTMAKCIEHSISNNLNFNLPAEAIHTAEFISDIDRLFDSFNGRFPKPESGKSYRRCLSDQSLHRELWLNLKPKISSWEFISGYSWTNEMPLKVGWISNINAVLELWDICRQLGFNCLRTRTLNQDPLENLFSLLRNFSDQNTNPNPYELISSFKTSFLTNLITPTCRRNCEKDDSQILDNLHGFLDKEDSSFASSQDFELINELNELQITDVDTELNERDSNVAAFVAGFLIRKIKAKIACNECLGNLLTMSKENINNKERLVYVTNEVIHFLMRLHNIIMRILPTFAHITHLTKKIKVFVKKHISFDFFTCSKHSTDVLNQILDASITLIVQQFAIMNDDI